MKFYMLIDEEELTELSEDEVEESGIGIFDDVFCSVFETVGESIESMVITVNSDDPYIDDLAEGDFEPEKCAQKLSEMDFSSDEIKTRIMEHVTFRKASLGFIMFVDIFEIIKIVME